MITSLIILCGGPGKEHEVSIRSGANALHAAQSAWIPVKQIVIQTGGEWELPEGIGTEADGIHYLEKSRALVFPVIHGDYGEDGEIQSLLESKGIPFIGSQSASMRLTIDKQATGDFLSKHGIRTPKSIVAATVDIEPPFGFPVIVKPKDEGSSVSLYKAQNMSELRNILEQELSARGEMLVQEFVQGREFSIGTIETNGVMHPLPPTEIILTKGDMFDYTAKYSIDGCVETTPANADPETLERLQELAMATHIACGCRDISRTDVIMKSNGEMVVLEINTIPGMTHTSFIPAQLRAHGESLEAFLLGMMQKYSA